MSGLFTMRALLSEGECLRISSELLHSHATPATVYGAANAIEPLTRRTKRVEPSTETLALLIERLTAARDRLSAEFATPLGELEPPQCLRYGIGDFFVAHQDGNTPLIWDDSRFRRVSVIVPLNCDYEGGALLIHGDREHHEVPLEPGTLVAFPSETTHEVLPVTAGERLTVVSWFRSAEVMPSQA
jgi:SM-20-related protein